MCTFERFCFLLSLLPATLHLWCIHDLPNLKVSFYDRKKGHENRTIKGALGTTMHAIDLHVVPRVLGGGGGDICLPSNFEYEEKSLCSTVHTQSRAALKL